MPERRVARRTERTVMMAIIRTLCYMPDTCCWATETVNATYRGRNGGPVTVYTLSKGKPDLVGFKGDKGFVMEVKLPGQYLEPHQRDWRDWFVQRTKAEGRYFVVRSVEEAEAAWKTI